MMKDAHGISYPTDPKTSTSLLDLVYMDNGEMTFISLRGTKYFLIFKDDFTHYITIYFMKTKDEATSKLQRNVKLVKSQLERKIKCLWFAKGKEIKNTKTKRLLDKLGILHTFSL